MRIFAFVVWVTLLLATLAVPLAYPDGIYLFVALVCAYTAYRGFTLRIVYRVFFALLVVEIFYGFNVGILSLGYVLAVGFLNWVMRFIAFVPWSYKRDWNIADAISAIAVSIIVYAGTIFSGVFIGNLLYGSGATVLRIQSLVTLPTVGIPMLIIILTTITLRRTEVPFRNTIHYGT